LPDVRDELVDEVRDAIEGGTYETDEKLTAAIDGLMPDLA
jgi:anti-sigma28 factor (negative regulator of flagellin synthesis)